MFQGRVLASVIRMVAATGVCVCLGCGSDTASTATSATGSGSPAGVTPELEHRLWRVAEGAAEGMGGRIESAEAVKSQHAAAVRLTSDAIVPGNEDVWAIQVEGVDKFVCIRSCSFPAGAQPPSGRFITIVINAETFETTDFGLAPNRVDLGELGSVIELHE